jgi:hypothetical protein
MIFPPEEKHEYSIHPGDDINNILHYQPYYVEVKQAVEVYYIKFRIAIYQNLL